MFDNCETLLTDLFYLVFSKSFFVIKMCFGEIRHAD